MDMPDSRIAGKGQLLGSSGSCCEYLLIIIMNNAFKTRQVKDDTHLDSEELVLIFKFVVIYRIQ